MADEEATSAQQIAEYESQLAGIVELLKESPDDESLLALKKDMEELLELSRANNAEDAVTATISNDGHNVEASEELQLPPPPLPPPPPKLEMNNTIADQASHSNAELSMAAGLEKDVYNQTIPSENANASAEVSTSKKEKPHKAKKSKKLKKVKDFVLPDHLIPNDEDTDAERNKKRRKAKALKSKWRVSKREMECNMKQASWQSFQKKSSSTSTGSIFSTKEGINDRVGVVSKKQLTDFGARKRHK